MPGIEGGPKNFEQQNSNPFFKVKEIRDKFQPLFVSINKAAREGGEEEQEKQQKKFKETYDANYDEFEEALESIKQSDEYSNLSSVAQEEIDKDIYRLLNDNYRIAQDPTYYRELLDNLQLINNQSEESVEVNQFTPSHIKREINSIDEMYHQYKDRGKKDFDIISDNLDQSSFMFRKILDDNEQLFKLLYENGEIVASPEQEIKDIKEDIEEDKKQRALNSILGLQEHYKKMLYKGYVKESTEE